MELQNFSKMELGMLILFGVLFLALLGYLAYTIYEDNKNTLGCDKAPDSIREPFSYDQYVLNAKNYTYIPTKQCNSCLPAARPDFGAMTCSSTGVPDALKGMSKEEIEREIDLHYRKPMEMLDTKDLLPETDVSGLSFGVDPGEDFANKFVWHRTTFARVKRRNWETGAAMIRGDLIIDPGKQSWFQHDNDYRDLTPGFIPKQYCGQVDVEDLTYNMSKAV